MQARNGLETVPGVPLEGAVWVVAAVAIGDEPQAAISFFDAHQVRRIFDFYFAAGFRGRRAAVALLRRVLELADDAAIAVSVGNTNISNTEYRALLGRFGFFEYLEERERDVVLFARWRWGNHERQFQKFIRNERNAGRRNGAARDDTGRAHCS